METSILNFMGFVENVDFALIGKFLAVGFLLFWIVVVGWVIYDASQRFPSIWMVVLSAALVLGLNLFGYVIYLIIRPRQTREEHYWADRERRYLNFETAGLEDCPKCGYPTQPNFIHCPRCGEALRVKCSSCEVYIEPEWAVCPFCGGKNKNYRAKQVFARPERSSKKRFPTVGPRVDDKKPQEPVKPEPTAEPVLSAEPQAVEAVVERPVEVIVPIEGDLPDAEQELPQQPVIPPQETSPAPVTEELKSDSTGTEKPKVKVGLDGFVSAIGRLPARLAVKLFTKPKKKKETVIPVETSSGANNTNKQGKKKKKHKRNR